MIKKRKFKAVAIEFCALHYARTRRRSKAGKKNKATKITGETKGKKKSKAEGTRTSFCKSLSPSLSLVHFFSLPMSWEKDHSSFRLIRIPLCSQFLLLI